MQHENIQGGQTKKDRDNAVKPVNNRDAEKEKAGKNQTDTAPDEFIAPNADTDVPLNNEGIVNDAVLRGEDHENEKPENRPDAGKQ
jgi:hypothetical protein